MSQHDRYISPFSTRYASDEMQYIFSDDNKFRTWRRLWVALARAEMKQGLTNITPEMVAEPAVSQGGRHHPSGCHQLLCRRQHRHHRDASGPRAGAQEAHRRAGKAGKVRRGV